MAAGEIFFDASRCVRETPESKTYDFDGDGVREIETTTYQICDNRGDNLEDLSFRTEGDCRSDTYTRTQLLEYLSDENLNIYPIKDRFAPDFGTRVPTATDLAGDPHLRACGTGAFAQARLPGTVVPATWAHSQIYYPSANAETGVTTTVEAADAFSAWGGTQFTVKRGSGDVGVNENTLIGTGDLVCYEVPTSGFCLGIDWSKGAPVVKEWADVEPCITKVPCPGARVLSDGTTVYDETDRTYDLWMFNSTHVVKNVGIDQAAQAVAYEYGTCNAMPTEAVIAATPITQQKVRQVDMLAESGGA